jgi:RecB family exonuclease
VRPEPLLLDEEREALSADLRTIRDGLEAERLQFLDAVLAAEERLVLSYPRFDTASGRERVPSSFLRRALEAALGRRLGADDLAPLADPGATALGRPHPLDPARAIDRVERDLALVTGNVRGAARHLAAPDGFLVRSLAQERSTRQRTLTEWDGVVEGRAEALAALRLAGRRWSASAVQDFAACPYRHFLKRGLKLRAWEEPERAYQIDSRDFGNLYHEVAHRVFAELAEGNGLPLRAEALAGLAARIEALVDEALAAFAAEGGVVNPALLDPVRVRLRSDIEEMLADDVKAADADEEFVPAAFEEEFADLAVPLARGAAVTFDGKIDRIDTTRRTRRVRVIDYKTGKYVWKQDEQWKGGTEVQLAIYNLAARAAYPKHEVAEAIYYYATAAGDYKRKACAATPDAEKTLRHVLLALDGLAAAGVFPPVADNCRFCDYQTVCGPFREDRARRKAADPRLGDFKALREIP